jgi:hypothetical protein
MLTVFEEPIVKLPRVVVPVTLSVVKPSIIFVDDPKSMTVIGDPEATAKLRRPYRAPYIHPEPDTV